MKVVVTGGTGFLGRSLVASLLEKGHEVDVVTRDPANASVPGGARAVSWSDLATAVDGAEAVVNLAGETIAQRWTAPAKARIVGSRASAAERVGAALRAAKKRPGVLVNASAVGFYGDRASEELTEASAPGTGFLAETTVAWEEAARRAAPEGVRLVLPRIGIVLGRGGRSPLEDAPSVPTRPRRAARERDAVDAVDPPRGPRRAPRRGSRGSPFRGPGERDGPRPRHDEGVRLDARPGPPPPRLRPGSGLRDPGRDGRDGLARPRRAEGPSRESLVSRLPVPLRTPRARPQGDPGPRLRAADGSRRRG